MTEQKQMTQEEFQSAMFSQLVVMLATSALQQMGKLVDPATGKTAVHLEGSQAMIDLIEMLSAKTKGNLDVQEEKLLKDTLHSLHMNYWETRQAEAQKAGDGAPKSEPAPEPAAPKPESGTDSKEPKFRKKYD